MKLREGINVRNLLIQKIMCGLLLFYSTVFFCPASRLTVVPLMMSGYYDEPPLTLRG